MEAKKTFIAIDDLDALLKCHDAGGGGYITDEAASNYREEIARVRKSK